MNILVHSSAETVSFLNHLQHQTIWYSAQMGRFILLL